MPLPHHRGCRGARWGHRGWTPCQAVSGDRGLDPRKARASWAVQMIRSSILTNLPCRGSVGDAGRCGGRHRDSQRWSGR